MISIKRYPRLVVALVKAGNRIFKMTETGSRNNWVR